MPLDSLQPDAANWLIAVWLFAFGGTIGSFLNVVVYRLPAGISLVQPGSHCPACKTPIRWFDNVPMLGWMVLRGRCRDCRAKISPRYPIVEAIAATLFLVLGVVEVLLASEEIFLPRTLAELYGTYGYHLMLLCTLLVAALIEYDGHRLPARLFFPAGLIGCLAPLVWPGLRPVSAVATMNGWTAAFADGTIGLAAGATLGLVVWRLLDGKRHLGTILGPACVGLFLGWQATLVPIFLTGVICLLLLPLGRLFPNVRRIPPIVWVALTTMVWILAWAPLTALCPFLG